MIEINLARQCRQPAIMVDEVSNRSYWWICAVLGLGIGMASWWWTKSQEQEYANLLQEKHIQAQLLAKTHTTLSRLEQYRKERQLLHDAFEVIHTKKSEEKQPIALLNGVSRSVEGLEIWLDRVQMVDQIVELRGQSFSFKHIGKYVDTLENHHVIISLPVVEIFEEKDRDSGKVFSFMIRFVLGQQVTT